LQNGVQAGFIVTLALPFQLMVEEMMEKNQARDSK